MSGPNSAYSVVGEEGWTEVLANRIEVTNRAFGIDEPGALFADLAVSDEFHEDPWSMTAIVYEAVAGEASRQISSE